VSASLQQLLNVVWTVSQQRSYKQRILDLAQFYVLQDCYHEDVGF
jgi:hypothetical protein